jgi:16S rRNA (guanine527-N7)-methyltransferase
MDNNSTRADEFSNAIKEYAPRFCVQLTDVEIARLREYYEQVMAWNTRLHLVAPCSASEFATRHILESLVALPHLSVGAHVADIGSGAGLPIIPCLIVRPDLRATLIESSSKKAVFLREALRRVGATNTAQVINERFEQLPAPDADFITCRALDRFTEMFQRIVEWSPDTSTLLLFGGDSLREQIEKYDLVYETVLIPESERRFLFIIKRSPKSKVESPKSKTYS